MIDWNFFWIYSLIFIITWWFYIGYLIYVFYLTKNKQFKSYIMSEYPNITVLIPCYNEAKIIREKIRNTKEIDYEKDKVLYLFCDGDSTDGTREIIKNSVKKEDCIRVINTKVKGKINQLNVVLSKIKSELIVISDSDGLLQKNSLKIIAATLSNKKTGLVGIEIIPNTRLKEENYFWEQQNRLRISESKLFSPLYAIGVCYGCKKEILKKFPSDVIADDIYASFLTISKGFRTVYTNLSSAKEIRCPNSIFELYKHKFRKINAFLIELFRFSGKFLNSDIRWKLIFYTRFGQITIAPFFLAAMLFLLIYVGVTSLTKLLFIISSLTLFLTYFIVRKNSLTGLVMKIKTFTIMHIILIGALISYLFYRQTSNYKRLKNV